MHIFSRVSVSILSVKGTKCKMVELGQVADVTGGQVNIVDPLKLTQEFGTILSDPIIATNVKVSTPTNYISRKHVYSSLRLKILLLIFAVFPVLSRLLSLPMLVCTSEMNTMRRIRVRVEPSELLVM